MRLKNYCVEDHGIEHEQYFQGCGVAFTQYSACITGCGNDAQEALDDALEQLAQEGIDVEAIEAEIKERSGIEEWPGPSVPDSTDDEDYSNHHYYLSIRYTTE